MEVEQMQDPATYLMESGQKVEKVRRITCREGHEFVAMNDHPGTGAEFLCPHCAQKRIADLKDRANQLQRLIAKIPSPAMEDWLPCYKEKPPHGVVVLVTFEVDGDRWVDRAFYDQWSEPSGAWVIWDRFDVSPERERRGAEAGTHWRFIPPAAPTMVWWAPAARQIYATAVAPAEA